MNVHNARMRWQLASTFAVTAMSAGCYEPGTVDCGDGFLCPEGQVCADPGFCGLPNLVEQCEGADRFKGCTYDTDDVEPERGLCLDGVCNPCSLDPNLAGCGGAEWFPMTVPSTADLLTIWVEPPTFEVPITFALAAGKTETGALGPDVLTYDGTRWTKAPLVGALPGEEVRSIWGATRSDVYAATTTQLLHSDGATWTNVTSSLPQGTDRLYDITGSSGTDVYAVGAGGTVVHFDGTSWSAMNTQPANWRAATATSQGIVAVGAAGTFRNEAAAVSQPMPAPYTNVGLNDVFLNGNTLTVVGGANANTRQSLFELESTWTLAAPAGTDNTLSLYGGWRNYVVGERGKIMRRDASGWTLMPVSADTNLYGIAGGGNEVFAVGAEGAIWRYTER